MIGAFLSGAKIIEKHFSNDPQKTFRDNEISFDKYALDNFLNKINQYKNMLSIKKTKTTKSEKTTKYSFFCKKIGVCKKGIKKDRRFHQKI